MVEDEVQRIRAEAVADEEGRPELSAESFSRPMRVGLLLITLAGEALMLAFAITAFMYPHGMLDASPFWAVYLGGIQVGLGFFLMVMYGGLVGNNQRITAEERMTWFMGFAFFGPITLPAYWFMYVWPAPLEPWTDPDLSQPAPAPHWHLAHGHV
jgi:hypothetical protein